MLLGKGRKSVWFISKYPLGINYMVINSPKVRYITNITGCNDKTVLSTFEIKPFDNYPVSVLYQIWWYIWTALYCLRKLSLLMPKLIGNTAVGVTIKLLCKTFYMLWVHRGLKPNYQHTGMLVVRFNSAPSHIYIALSHASFNPVNITNW